MRTSTLTRLGSALFLSLFVFSATPALALDGHGVLVKVEETMNKAKDRKAKIKMTITDRKGNVKKREMKVLNKGDEKRLFTFLSPADVRGVSFLVINDDKTYLYMPAFRKIRRIASSAKSENFMGTDFSYNDLSKGDYPDKYDAKIDKKDSSKYYLTCKPKPDHDTDYSKLEMVVDKESFLPTKIKMYDKAGKVWKVLTTPKIEKIDGYWSTKKMVMKDLQKDHETVMELVEIKHDVGLSNREFSKRNLKRFH